MLPDVVFGASFLLWNDGTRLTYTPDSPLATTLESDLLRFPVLTTSKSEFLSWRTAGLGASTCLGRNSLPVRGAVLTGFVRSKGTGLTKAATEECSSWSSVQKKNLNKGVDLNDLV